MKSFNVTDRRNGNLLLTINCFDSKIYALMLKQFKKMKGINVKEVAKDE